MSTIQIQPTSMAPSAQALPDSVEAEVERTTWLDFAAILLFLVGMFNVTAFFNAIAHLSAAKTYPVWSITIVVLDLLIMYGLIVHSGRRSKIPA